MASSLDIPRFLEKAQTLPVIDVRSPGEYEQGHIPGAVNIPLFSNEERARVGTRYKQISKDSAVMLGLELIGPKLVDFVKKSRKVAPEGEVLVHCWRGGMRSGSFAWLLETAGMKVSLLQSGYKAYRQEVLRAFEQPLPLLVLGGKTGSGKTDLLHELKRRGEQVLDLEGLANHKGSSFGALGQAPQPSTEQFENRLHQAWLQLDRNRRVWVEDESLMIGTVTLPQGLWNQMRSAPVAFMDVPKAHRISRLVKEYGTFGQEQLLAAVNRIQKRLGGLNHRLAVEALQQADYAAVADITLNYYDKAYLFGLSQRKDARIFEIPLLTDLTAEQAALLLNWVESTPFASVAALEKNT